MLGGFLFDNSGFFSRIGNLTLDYFYAEIAQRVERRTENPGVPSANLGLGTIFLFPHQNPVNQVCFLLGTCIGKRFLKTLAQLLPYIDLG